MALMWNIELKQNVYKTYYYSSDTMLQKYLDSKV